MISWYDHLSNPTPNRFTSDYSHCPMCLPFYVVFCCLLFVEELVKYSALAFETKDNFVPAICQMPDAKLSFFKNSLEWITFLSTVS